MLSCAEQVQIQKYETHAYKTLKTVGVQVIMLKHPTKHKKNTHKTHIRHNGIGVCSLCSAPVNRTLNTIAFFGKLSKQGQDRGFVCSSALTCHSNLLRLFAVCLSLLGKSVCISVWQHVRLYKRARPSDTPACC